MLIIGGGLVKVWNIILFGLYFEIVCIVFVRNILLLKLAVLPLWPIFVASPKAAANNQPRELTTGVPSEQLAF
jgi:hypothetical protein